MTKPLPLRHFEKIDGLFDQLTRMGDFMVCADPRAWISLSNRLLDACLDAGMDYDTPCHNDWAAEAIVSTLCAA